MERFKKGVQTPKPTKPVKLVFFFYFFFSLRPQHLSPPTTPSLFVPLPVVPFWILLCPTEVCYSSFLLQFLFIFWSFSAVFLLHLLCFVFFLVFCKRFEFPSLRGIGSVFDFVFLHTLFLFFMRVLASTRSVICISIHAY